MKQFFRTIKQTFTSKELYLNTAHQSGWKGIRFLLKLALFLGLVFGVIALIVLLAVAPFLKSKVSGIASTTYPDGLVVTIANGTLTTNTLEPVVVPLSASWKDKNDPKNIFVIAPGETADASVLARYDAVAVATSRAIIAGTDHQIRVYPYGDSTQTITKESFTQNVTDMLAIGATVLAVSAIPLIIVMTMIQVVSKLVLLVLITCILWIIFKIRKEPRTFRSLYRMGIYALVPAVLIDIIAIPLGLSGAALTTAIVLVIILSVTRDIAAPSVEPEPVVEV